MNKKKNKFLSIKDKENKMNLRNNKVKKFNTNITVDKSGVGILNLEKKSDLPFSERKNYFDDVSKMTGL